MAADPRRISVQDTRTKRQSSAPPLLVCIYPNEKWHEANLEGSIGMEEFEKLKPSLPRDREIIFY